MGEEKKGKRDKGRDRRDGKSKFHNKYEIKYQIIIVIKFT